MALAHAFHCVLSRDMFYMYYQPEADFQVKKVDLVQRTSRSLAVISSSGKLKIKIKILLPFGIYFLLLGAVKKEGKKSSLRKLIYP